MSQTRGKLNTLLRICLHTGNSSEGCFPDKSFPWEETESAFCKGLWKTTLRIQTDKILWEHQTFYYQNILASETSKSFYLAMKRHREIKWLLTAAVVYGTEKIISFPSVMRPPKLLAPRLALQALPPARRLAAHRPAERCLLEHSPFMPKFLLLKLCPTGSVKMRYWRHSSYTWMWPHEFSCGDGTQRAFLRCAGIFT